MATKRWQTVQPKPTPDNATRKWGMVLERVLSWVQLVSAQSFPSCGSSLSQQTDVFVFEGLIFLGWSKGTSKGKPPLWTSLLWPVRWYEQGSKAKGQGQRHIPSRWSGDSSPHGKCVYAGRWPCPKSALFYLAFCAGFASLSICVRLSGWFKEKPEVEPPFWGSPCFDTFRMVCEWPLPLPLGD